VLVRRALVAACAAVAVALISVPIPTPQALGQTSASTGRVATDFVRELSVEGFDSSLGTLIAADITVAADIDSRVATITNSSTSTEDYRVTTRAELCVDLASAQRPDFASCSATASATKVALDLDVLTESFVGLVTGETATSPQATMASALVSDRVTDPNALQFFVDNSQIDFRVATLADFETFGGGGNSLVEIETFAEVRVDVRYLVAGIEIDKRTNGDDGLTFEPGQAVSWTYDVTNTGNTALQNVIVDDDVEGQICVIDLLDAGTSSRCTAAGIAGERNYSNTATVTAQPVASPDTTMTDQDDSSYLVRRPTPVPTTVQPSATPVPQPTDSRPAIDIELATNGVDADQAPGVLLVAGDTVTWSYVVTNSGVVDLFNVVISDDIVGDFCTADFIPVLGQVECERTGIVVDDALVHEIVGEVVGESVDGQRVTDQDPTHHHTGDEVLGDVVDPPGAPSPPEAPTQPERHDSPDSPQATTIDVPESPAAVTADLPRSGAPGSPNANPPSLGTDRPLARTGSEVGIPLQLASGLVVIGCAAVAASRLRRRRSSNGHGTVDDV